MHESQDRNELDEFERQLLAYQPRQNSFDRGVLFFRLGQESTRPRHQSARRALLAWRTATVVLASLSAGLLWNMVRNDDSPIAQWVRPSSVVEPYANGEREGSTSSPLSVAPATDAIRGLPASQLPVQGESTYLQHRSLVLASGWDAIPNFPESYGSQNAGPATFQELRRIMFEF